MEHLIADSGIHFITTEIEFNPTEPLLLPSGKALKYSFCQTKDPILGEEIFDMLVYHPESEAFIPMDQLSTENVFKTLPDGSQELDAAGVPILKNDFSAAFFSNYAPDAPEVISINNPYSYRVRQADENGRAILVNAFDLLLNRWLPMPMFERLPGGASVEKPTGWCRVRIEPIGEGSKKGSVKYRLNWAFDTRTATDPDSDVLPYFYEDEEKVKEFALCNYAYSLIKFLSTDSNVFSGFSDYIASLLGVDPAAEGNKYLAYYIYFINFLRLSGAAPQVKLHNPPREKDIPVDLVLDIGNSRTCGVLFEEGDFTRAMMLGLRDLSHPERVYTEPFDMRLAFRKPDLGNDIDVEEDIFNWQSFVRLGREAGSLIYHTIDNAGLSRTATNHSSPKRYLWDSEPFDGKWECIVTEEDPSHLRLAPNVYIPGLSNLFDHEGNYIGRIPEEERPFDDAPPAYSRGSLMTLVLIEIFQHAIAQINSTSFRYKHGNIDLRRYLRNIILTCPTAMPIKEQIRLRQAAADAFHAITRCEKIEPANIIPDVNSLTAGDSFDVSRRSWSYDEASCSQLVYLYAEIAQRYAGEIDKFFELKGHIRPELAEEGYNKKSLTIGTIDIGAGTTDIMVCSYKYEGKEKCMLSPRPLFWDSFYLAGDDILKAVVQNLVIEGPDMGTPMLGNISSALKARLEEMTAEEIQLIPIVAANPVFNALARDVDRSGDPGERCLRRHRLAANLVHAFFGKDSSLMSHKDRQCRIDFNTQVSHPMAQFFLEQLRRKAPSNVYDYEEIFSDNKPAGYLLDYFANHFGFRFEELRWRFDPEETARIVKNTMEPLLKQLAVVFHAYNCDILVLAGRPTSLDSVTELFIKYLPISPDRLVRLNSYRVGQWFPFADGQGYFFDQKAVVAVGAMVGHQASREGFNGMWLDFEDMKKKMVSTARYMGVYRSRRQLVADNVLTPESSTATIDVNVFPTFIGCKQFSSPQYQARPIYGIYNLAGKNPLRLTISRNYYEDRETLTLEDVTDMEGNPVARSRVKLVQMSLVDDGSYWLDRGEFELTVVGMDSLTNSDE
ncbi:MAG: virulence factor SrfB [Clostridium sp.]|nr:virulence factor SrfB [Prevotella sp.]MCM1429049.1 virulence factor SrfB [Clostridium sp.]